MTKSWEEIRVEACTLYRAGKSLTEVRKQLEREHNFYASDRAFRLKLKQWKAKRGAWTTHGSDQTQSLQSDSVAFVSKGRLSSAPQVRTEEDVFVVECTRTPLLTAAAPEPLQDDDGNVSTECSTNATLHDLYQRLETCAAASRIESMLDGAKFLDGTDCILHFASARHNETVLRSIIDYMRTTNINIGIRDLSGSSALDTAIRGGQIKNVDVLVQAGISVNSRNHSGRTPLHTAILIRADWIICDLLLKNGAKPNTLCRISPYQLYGSLSLATYVDHTQSSFNEENQLRTIRALLNAGAAYHPDSKDGRAAYRNFLTKLDRHVRSGHEPSEAFKECLRLFLKQGSGPTWWYDGPSQCSCSTLAQYLFFHATHTTLPDILIESCDLKQYGSRLVTTLLVPCRDWSDHFLSTEQPRLVRKVIFSMGSRLPLGFNPLSVALASSPACRKATLVNSLLCTCFDFLSVHAYDDHLGRPLTNLTNVEEPLRWHLAEMLLRCELDLAQNVHDSHLPASDKPRIFVYDPLLALHMYRSPSFRDVIASYLNIFPRYQPPTFEEEVHQCVRCVIHVLTKWILENRNLNVQRVNDALEMRQEYGLPDLFLDMTNRVTPMEDQVTPVPSPLSTDMLDTTSSLFTPALA